MATSSSSTLVCQPSFAQVSDQESMWAHQSTWHQKSYAKLVIKPYRMVSCKTQHLWLLRKPIYLLSVCWLTKFWPATQRSTLLANRVGAFTWPSLGRSHSSRKVSSRNVPKTASTLSKNASLRMLIRGLTFMICYVIPGSKKFKSGHPRSRSLRRRKIKFSIWINSSL